MRNNYKLPWHIRQFVKRELMDYKTNKRLLANYKGDTRTLIIATTRLDKIDKVFERLNEEDRDAAEAIFNERYTQVGAEMAKGITKAMYYNVMNKVIYLVAQEMDLI